MPKTKLSLNSLMTKQQKRDYVAYQKRKIREHNTEVIKQIEFEEEVEFLRGIMKEPEDSFTRWLFIESRLEPSPVFSKVIRLWFPIFKFPRQIRFSTTRRSKV